MNPQNGQTPLDYLNQIAPSTPKRPPFRLNFRTIIVGAIILIVLVGTLSLIVSSISNSRKEPWEQLSARLTTTQKISTDATNNLTDSQLRSLNSNLKLYLTNTQRDIAGPLGRMNINTAKLSPNVVANESGADSTARLEDARLNAKFDSTYAREISYQLATILSLYQKLYGNSGNEATKTFLKSSYDNLVPIQKSFTDYSAAKE